MSEEFSRRVDIHVFKIEPLSREDWTLWASAEEVDSDDPEDIAVIDALYARYLKRFQPYRWHAQSGNGELVAQGESYFTPAGVINAIQLLFGDDTTVYWMRQYGEDRGEQLLRYGKTDRDHQAVSE